MLRYPLLLVLPLPMLLVVLLSAPVLAKTIHVPSEQPTIQAGIDVASPGDSVLVAPGSYAGPGNRNITFAGKDIVVASSGGYQVTTLWPGSVGFVFESGETSAAVLDGFTINGAFWGLEVNFGSAPTIRNCLVINSVWLGCRLEGPGPVSFFNCQIHGTEMGRGMEIVESEAGIEITNCKISDNVGGIWARNGGSIDVVGCTFQGNAGVGEGGGLLLGLENGVANVIDTDFIDNECAQFGGGGLKFYRSGTLNVERCTFVGNVTTQAGGGLFATSFGPAEIEMWDCVFRANVARWGGGAYVQPEPSSPPPTVARCSFSGNSATDNGGGLQIVPQDTSAHIDFCVFLENTAPRGAAFYSAQGYSYIMNCTFALNESPQSAAIIAGGHGVYIDNTIIAYSIGQGIECETWVYCTCSDLFGNTGGDWVWCVDGQLGIDGNICEDPLFCDITSGDLTLDHDSPCAPGNSPADCELIGAYSVGCGTVGTPESPVPRSRVRLMVNPNPVLHTTTFTPGQASGPIVIDIYDPAGRLVERLQSRAAVTWTPGDHVARGVYYAKVGGREASDTVKFVVLK